MRPSTPGFSRWSWVLTYDPRLEREGFESSDGIAPGSIQVAGNGLPMVMMADRQTVGGYAKIATVITADLPVLAQCRPKDEVRFLKVSYQKAVSIYKKEQKQINKVFHETGGN